MRQNTTPENMKKHEKKKCFWLQKSALDEGLTVRREASLEIEEAQQVGGAARKSENPLHAFYPASSRLLVAVR